MRTPSIGACVRNSGSRCVARAVSKVCRIATNTPIIPEDSEVELQPTFASQRVVQRALLSRFRQPLVIEKGVMPGAITGAALLIAIFEEQDSHAVFCLQQRGATLESVKSKLSARNSWPRASCGRGWLLFGDESSNPDVRRGSIKVGRVAQLLDAKRSVGCVVAPGTLAPKSADRRGLSRRVCPPNPLALGAHRRHRIKLRTGLPESGRPRAATGH